MDEEGEADLYGDLLPFNRTNDEDYKRVENENASLRKEVSQLKQKIESLSRENGTLSQNMKKLETNFSSLMKTAQTEIKRKDQTIAELRREKDSVVFRRGRNTRYDNRPQERNYPETRQEAQRPEPVDQLEATVPPKPLDKPVVELPVEKETVPVVIPDMRQEETDTEDDQMAEIAPVVSAIVPKINHPPQTIFSKRQSLSANKPVAEVIAPPVSVGETKSDKVRSSISVPLEATTTPETNPEIKKKKRITPVLISEPTSRAVDQNKNRINSPMLSIDRSTTKVSVENNERISEVTTPKVVNAQINDITPTNDSITIPKSKIVTHVKASFNTTNSKTKDFKRRVSSNVKDSKSKPESSSTSSSQRNPIFMSENSCDGLRKPSNYDLMKRNIKHKYQSLDSPRKSPRSRRSRSRSVAPRERHDRSTHSHRRRKSRRKESLGRGEFSNRRSPSRRLTKVETKTSTSRRSPMHDGSSKRDSISPRRRVSPTVRKVPTYSDLQNFSPVRSSTAKKDSERKSSRDRSVSDNHVPSASKSKVRLDDVLEKSIGKLSSADKLDQTDVALAMKTSKKKVVESTTEIASSKPTDMKKVTASTIVTSPLKETEEKRKSIEAVADSLTIKLTSKQTTETTTKSVDAFNVPAAPKQSTSATVNDQETLVQTTETTVTDFTSILTKTTIPLSFKTFLPARIMADYKTPTGSAENSTEISQTKTMSPPEVPKPKSGHGPTSFSGLKLGGDPKHFSYPFTPMKIDIANECINFPSLITPLKATPVKVGVYEEDSLDLVKKMHLTRNKDQLGVNDVVRLEQTVTRVEKEVEWKLQAIQSNSLPSEKEDEGKIVSDEIEPNESAEISGEVSVETGNKNDKKTTSDLEDGELTHDDSSIDTSKEQVKPIVSSVKKGKTRTEPKGKKTRIADVKKVVSEDKMSDLRQKLLARSECVAPPRKDMRDYEIRLKSPYKTNPRVSSASVANRTPRKETSTERLTYNDCPSKSSRSKSPENRTSLSRSRSPTSMFLSKSPERLQLRNVSPDKACGERRSRSPKVTERAVRQRLSPHRKATSSSRSRSPQIDVRSPLKKSVRHSASTSHSRSPSPKQRVQIRPQRPPSSSHSRSKSPNPNGANHKRVSNFSRSKPRSRSRSNSPARDLQNGPSKINERLRQMASCNGNGGDSPFTRRRTRVVRESSSRRRSRSKSPIKMVSHRDGHRKTGRAVSKSLSPDVGSRGNGNVDEARPFRRRRVVRLADSNSQSGESAQNRNRNEQMKLIDRILDSDSGISEKNISPVRKTNKDAVIANDSSKAKRVLPCVMPTASNLPDILSTLDDSQPPVKSMSPVESLPVKSMSPVEPLTVKSKTPVESQPPVKPLPSVEPLPVKPMPTVTTVASLTESLNVFVNNLVQNTNPDLQKCLESIQKNFTPTPVVSDIKATTTTEKSAAPQTAPVPNSLPTSNGFGGRKRRIARLVTKDTPLPVQSPTRVSESMKAPTFNATRSSESTPVKPVEPLTLATTPNDTGSVSSGPRNQGSQASSPANSLTSQSEAATSDLPFSRRRRTIRAAPKNTSPTVASTPTKEMEVVRPAIAKPSAAESSRLEQGHESNVATQGRHAEFPILEKALGWPSNNPDRSDCSVSAINERKRNISGTSDASKEQGEKRKRDSSEEQPWKKRKRVIKAQQVAKPNVDLVRKAKSLFGSDTDEEQDFNVKHSEYAKLAGETSEEDPYVSEPSESTESDDEYKPARSHSRKKPVDSDDEVVPSRNHSRKKPVDSDDEVVPSRSHSRKKPVDSDDEVVPSRSHSRKKPVDSDDEVVPSRSHSRKKPVDLDDEVVPSRSHSRKKPVDSDDEVVPSRNHSRKKPVDSDDEVVPSRSHSRKKPVDSDEEVAPTRSRTRKEPSDSDDDFEPASSPARKEPSPQQTSIWPARPEEPKRRQTVFLDALPTPDSKKMIKALLHRANKSIGRKKKRRHGSKLKGNSSDIVPKSAEFVPTDDSDD